MLVKSVPSTSAMFARQIKYVMCAFPDTISTRNFSHASRRLTRCKGNCLRCFDDTENCASCPISLFTFQEEIISEKKEDNILGNIFGLFMGLLPFAPKVKMTEVKLISKCAKECPKTYKNHEVIINLAERKCLLAKKR